VRTGKRMPNRYNEEAWRELTRLREAALQFQIAAEAGYNFLISARDLDEQTKGRLQMRAEEARFLSMQVSDSLMQSLLLELAKKFEDLTL
jgi:hypothetical protein